MRLLLPIHQNWARGKSIVAWCIAALVLGLSLWPVVGVGVAAAQNGPPGSPGSTAESEPAAGAPSGKTPEPTMAPSSTPAATPEPAAPAAVAPTAIAPVALPASEATVVVASPALSPSATVKAAPAPTASTPNAHKVKVMPGRDLVLKPRLTWDLLLEGAAGFPLHGKVANTFFGRARAGVLWIGGASAVAFGPTLIGGGITDWGAGAEAEVFSMRTGLSMQVGGGYLDGNSGELHVSLNYALLGIEWQHRFAPSDSDALFFKLRVPVGALVAVFSAPEVRGSAVRPK